MRAVAFAALLFVTVLATACDRGQTPPPDAPGAPRIEGEALPAPAGAAGSVTDMPDRPGPGPVGPPPAQEAAVPLDAQGDPVLPGTAADGTIAEATVPAPRPEDAMAVLRDYFAALNSGDFARAYLLWADGGRASGQTPQEFAAALGETAGMSIELSAPRRVQTADGSQAIAVPVTLVTSLRDGSQQRLAGTVLLRAEATGEAGATVVRIASAQLQPPDAVP